jgi:hypothetical protein
VETDPAQSARVRRRALRFGNLFCVIPGREANYGAPLRT